MRSWAASTAAEPLLADRVVHADELGRTNGLAPVAAYDANVGRDVVGPVVDETGVVEDLAATVIAHEQSGPTGGHALHEMGGDLDAPGARQHVFAQLEYVGHLGLVDREHDAVAARVRVHGEDHAIRAETVTARAGHLIVVVSGRRS